MIQQMECTRPEVINSERGVAFVCGAGRCLWRDLERAPTVPFEIVAVNFAGVFIPQVKHWVSLHNDIFSFILPARTYLQHAIPEMPMVHSWERPAPMVDVVWKGGPVNYSGLFAIRVALALGYDPIILCGMPQDTTGHFYEPHYAPSYSYEHLQPVWYDFAEEYRGRIFSMSGRTKELFGEPR